MRPILYLLLLLFTGGCLLACQKENITPEVSTSLVGKWQWESSNGGITGQDKQTPASTKTQVVIQFTSDSRYIQYRNGNKVQETTYTLQPGKSIYDATGQSILISIDGTGILYTYRLDKNDLYLFEECNDCYAHHYVRMVK